MCFFVQLKKKARLKTVLAVDYLILVDTSTLIQQAEKCHFVLWQMSITAKYYIYPTLLIKTKCRHQITMCSIISER